MSFITIQQVQMNDNHSMAVTSYFALAAILYSIQDSSKGEAGNYDDIFLISTVR